MPRVKLSDIDIAAGSVGSMAMRNLESRRKRSEDK